MFSIEKQIISENGSNSSFNFELKQGNGVEIYLLISGEESVAQSFYERVQQSIGDNLYESLENLRGGLLLDQKFTNLSFCVVAFYESYLYALVGGGASLCLSRNGQKAPLLKTLRGVNTLISGKAKLEDIYVLETADSEKLNLTVSSQKQEEPFIPHESIDNQDSPQSIKMHNGFREKLASKIDVLLQRLPERKIVVHGDEYQKVKAKVIKYQKIKPKNITLPGIISKNPKVKRTKGVKIKSIETKIQPIFVIGWRRTRRTIFSSLSVPTKLIPSG